ncbi:hypothetical protein ACFSQ7_08845 [Paenibacillus rhizoplanae]
MILAFSDLEDIVDAPGIPVTAEDKGDRLLHYLHRHCDVPGEPVVIHPLSRSYNLTYSPNLQELVYIIDRLQNEDLLIREGMNFTLTPLGWEEAVATAGGRTLQKCTVLLPDNEKLQAEWQDKLWSKNRAVWLFTPFACQQERSCKFFGVCGGQQAGCCGPHRPVS